MNHKNLKTNIRAEAERGDSSITEAEHLLKAGLLYGATSRAYYAVFHYARGLCFAVDEEPESHAGVAHLLALHYVRSGRLPIDTSRLFASLQKFREASDYDAAFVIDHPGAEQALVDAKTLVERFRRHLETEGLL